KDIVQDAMFLHAARGHISCVRNLLEGEEGDAKRQSDRMENITGVRSNIRLSDKPALDEAGIFIPGETGEIADNQRSRNSSPCRSGPRLKPDVVSRAVDHDRCEQNRNLRVAVREIEYERPSDHHRKRYSSSSLALSHTSD